MKVNTSGVRLLSIPQDYGEGAGKEQVGTNKGFSDMLKDAVNKVNSRLVEAEDLSTRLAMGEDLDIAGVMSTMTKASISFRLLLQVRNKALGAYEEIMRMQF